MDYTNKHIVKIDPSIFILNEDKLKISAPPAELIIKQKMYLQDEEFNKPITWIILAPKEYFILETEDGTFLFENIDGIDFSSEEEIDCWLNKQNGLIGLIDFIFPDNTIYLRYICPDGPTKIQPLSITSAELSPVDNFMFYYRNIDQTLQEYVLLNTDSIGYVSINVGVKLTEAQITLL